MRQRNTLNGGTVSIEIHGETFEEEYVIEAGCVWIGQYYERLSGMPAHIAARHLLEGLAKSGNLYSGE